MWASEGKRASLGSIPLHHFRHDRPGQRDGWRFAARRQLSRLD